MKINLLKKLRKRYEWKYFPNLPPESKEGERILIRINPGYYLIIDKKKRISYKVCDDGYIYRNGYTFAYFDSDHKIRNAIRLMDTYLYNLLVKRRSEQYMKNTYKKHFKAIYND